MGEEDLLGEWQSALELSQHQTEEEGEELRLPTPQVPYPHPCSHKPVLPLWARKWLNSVGLHWLVLSSGCVWDSGKWNWISITGQPRCLSHLTQICSWFSLHGSQASISASSWPPVLYLSLRAVLVSGICLLAELLALLNTPGWAPPCSNMWYLHEQQCLS